MGFDLAFAASITPQIASTLGMTLIVCVMSCLLAALIGFALEIMRRINKATRLGLRFTIDFIRSTPILVQLYFLYYVLPVYGVQLPAVVVGIAALSLYYSGYLSEVFKAGIDGIGIGQWEAAKALGLNRLKTVALVIAPQMLRNIAAPMGGYFISIFKSTPYLAVIAVPESFGSALDIASDTFRYAEPMAVVGAIFLSIALTLSFLVRKLEAHLMRSAVR